MTPEAEGKLARQLLREAQRRSQRPLRTSARAILCSAALLRWAHNELNFECDESTFAQVARTGDITMLEQLRGWGVPCDARASASAATPAVPRALYDRSSVRSAGHRSPVNWPLISR